MKKDVPIEIEIVEAGQPRPQRPGPEPSNTKGLWPFPLPHRPVACPRAARTRPLSTPVCFYGCVNSGDGGFSPAAPTGACH